MLSNNDYSEMMLEELILKETKMKSQKVMVAVLIGAVFGIAIYAATHEKGFIITVFLLVSAFLIGNRYSQNLKNIQAEISSRNTAG